MAEETLTRSVNQRPGWIHRGALWAIGLGLIVAALASFTVSALLRSRSAGLARHAVSKKGLSLRPISIPARFGTVQAVPADPGSLEGCNLLLITLDTTRADRIGCYGNRDIQTPTLDRLASEGVMFSRGTAVAPTTLPTHTSILTGLYPVHHGARVNGIYRLDDGRQTLAETMRQNGYRTGAVISAFVLDSQFGLAQGFDQYDDNLADCDEPPRKQYKERKAKSTTDRAIAWLRGTAGNPFFYWVHYFDPHLPYEPPSPFAERYEQNRYDGEIAFVDAQLSRLIATLDELGLTERTLVVIVGDHGESLGQHAEWTHACLVYESTLRIPLIFRCGRRLGGGVHLPHRVSQVDIVPTALSLLGLENPARTDGHDLTEPVAPDRLVYFETLHALLCYGWAPLVGVYEERYKYIEAPRPELYDLSRDPFELRNLYDEQLETAKRLRGELPQLFGPDLALIEADQPNVNLNAADQEKLAALGYIVVAATTSAAGARPDPKDMMPALHLVEFADDPAKPTEQTIAELLEVIEEYPDFYPAWKYLGNAYGRAGDLERAAEVLKRCIELRPDVPDAVYDLALVKVNQGDLSGAMVLLEQIIGEYPDHLRARYLLGTTLSSLGRHDEAADHVWRVFVLDPAYEKCTSAMIRIFTAAGRETELRTIFRDQLTANPHSPGVCLALAKHLERAREFAEAEAVLRQGHASMPGDPTVVNALALLLATCPDGMVRDLTGATAIIEQFCRGADPQDPAVLFTLTSLYAAQGRYESARTTAETAATLASQSGDQELIAALNRLRERLRTAPPVHNSDLAP